MWKQLTIDDLRTTLAKDELQKLLHASVQESTSQTAEDVVQQCLDDCADAYRGAFLAKGYKIDSTEHTIPDSYKIFVLAFARWQLWCRFPYSSTFALDDARQKLLDKALELLKTPYIGVDPVPDSPEPEPSPSPSDNQNRIFVPYQRFPDMPPCAFKDWHL